MRYFRTVLVGILSVLCVLLLSFGLFHWSKDWCPEGTFACRENNVCVPQRNICNNYADCPGGDDEDETLCYDIRGSFSIFNRIFNRTGILKKNKYNNSNEHICELNEYPQTCRCKRSTRLFCKNLGLTEVPQTISQDVTDLILANNSIHVLQVNSFSKFNLRRIHLAGNKLGDFPPGIFLKQYNLQKLILENNSLTILQPKTFTGLTKLTWLFLNHNHLQKLYLSDFEDLVSLEWIDLSHNQLALANESFPELPNLLEIVLDNNLIQVISKDLFSNLTQLEYLNLRKNRIRFIDENAFSKLKILRELNLSQNLLETLPSNLFYALTLLSKLSLGHNPLRHVPSVLFENLHELRSLNMDAIEITNIDIKMFEVLTNLESIYFKTYSYCSYVPMVPRCRPLSDGISSMENLLGEPVLRYTTWIVCVITCFGNSFVLWGRRIFHDENKALSLIIRNLAVADLLMGIYLLVIGVHDKMFRENYNRKAHKWMSSWSCTLAGMVAMTSSEVSVCILVFMSVERYLLIADPFGRHNILTIHNATVILILIWSFGFGIAIIPAFQWHTSTRYYGINGMCFPLHIHDPYLLGWQYSAFVFIGLNAAGLLIIVAAYSGMFVSIYQTRNATSLPMRDYEFAVRFFFIVLTDVGCWLPIISIKTVAFFNIEIPAGIYAWIVVFILPINSAVNPILYTLTTPKYRSQLFKVAYERCIRQKPCETRAGLRRSSPHSNAETESTPGSRIVLSGYNLKCIFYR